MRILIVLFAIVFSVHLKAQNKQDIHVSMKLSINDKERQVRESEFVFTAIALKSTVLIDFSKIAFIHDQDTTYFQNDLHATEGGQYYYSTLIHFDEAVQSIDLHTPDRIAELEAVLVNGSGEYAKFAETKRRTHQNNNCELTNVVEQSEWRSGLPRPIYNRNFTTVRNMIIHHSAGSNTIADYTQAVRNIYIMHTEERGWSDIGYNYLVAPNGVVYAGRDPGAGDQDKVIGAHFCGSNSNTMGVCLLGNYEEVEPSTELIESLESILSWKAFKDDLEVSSSSNHPLGANLPVVAGHRDGCSTLCPGENVYNRLEEIRMIVNEKVAACRGGEEEEENEEEEEPSIIVEDDSVLSQKIYPNPVSNFLFSLNISEDKKENLQFIWVINQEGKQIKWEGLRFSENKIEVTLPNTLPPGLYFLQLIFKSQESITQRFFVLE